jgi:hypothetical protein
MSICFVRFLALSLPVLLFTAVIFGVAAVAPFFFSFRNSLFFEFLTLQKRGRGLARALCHSKKNRKKTEDAIPYQHSLSLPFPANTTPP